MKTVFVISQMCLLLEQVMPSSDPISKEQDDDSHIPSFPLAQLDPTNLQQMEAIVFLEFFMQLYIQHIRSIICTEVTWCFLDSSPLLVVDRVN